MRIERIEAEDPRWGTFSAFPPSLIFHRAAWLRMMESCYRLEPAIYALVEDDKIKAALTGYLFNWYLGKIFFAGIYEGGYLGDAQAFETLFELLRPRLRGDGIAKIRILQSIFTPSPGEKGFRRIDASQHVLRLKGLTEETLWKQVYYNRMRNAIRKTQKHNVEVVPIDSVEKAEIVYLLNEELIKRRKTFSSFNRKMLGELYTRFLATGSGAGWLAMKDGVCIAGLVNVYSDSVSHGLIAGSKAEYLSIPANDLLFHEAIVDAIRKGKEWYDFMCSAPTKQLRLYKEKFGTTEYPTCFLEADVNPHLAKIWDVLWKLVQTGWGAKLARLVTK